MTHAEITPEASAGRASRSRKNGIVPSACSAQDDARPGAGPAGPRPGCSSSRCPRPMAGRRCACRPRIEPDRAVGAGEATRLQDEYHEHRAPVPRARERRGAFPRRARLLKAARRSTKGHLSTRRSRRSAQPARHVAESGVHLRSAHPIRPRSHRARAQGQARSGHRP